MKKKSLITMVASLSLVAAVGVGSTLAYLSSTSGPLVNTFTASNGYENAEVQIQENKYLGKNAETGTTETGYTGLYDGKTSYSTSFMGNNYEDLLPGDVLLKDPNVVLDSGSIASYLLVKVVGADALNAYTVSGVDAFTISDFSSTWTKVAELDSFNNVDTTAALDTSKLDGVYAYIGNDATPKYIWDPGTTTSDIFDSVTYNGLVTEAPNLNLDADGPIPSISVSAAAVQGDNVADVATALAALPTGF